MNTRKTLKHVATWMVSVSLLAGVARGQEGVTDGSWPSYGGDAGSTKYSSLDQIDRENFGDLEIAWRWRGT